MARVVVSDADVGLEVVGVDGLGLVGDSAIDELMKGVLANVGDALDTEG